MNNLIHSVEKRKIFHRGNIIQLNYFEYEGQIAYVLGNELQFCDHCVLVINGSEFTLVTPSAGCLHVTTYDGYDPEVFGVFATYSYLKERHVVFIETSTYFTECTVFTNKGKYLIMYDTEEDLLIYKKNDTHVFKFSDYEDFEETVKLEGDTLYLDSTAYDLTFERPIAFSVYARSGFPKCTTMTTSIPKHFICRFFHRYPKSDRKRILTALLVFKRLGWTGNTKSLLLSYL